MRWQPSRSNSNAGARAVHARGPRSRDEIEEEQHMTDTNGGGRRQDAAGSVGDNVIVESDGAVRIVTLNRPGSMNAFDADLHDALIDALRRIGRDRDARAIVLTGAGRAFSAGGDLER